MFCLYSYKLFYRQEGRGVWSVAYGQTGKREQILLLTLSHPASPSALFWTIPHKKGLWTRVIFFLFILLFQKSICIYFFVNKWAALWQFNLIYFFFFPFRWSYCGSEFRILVDKDIHSLVKFCKICHFEADINSPLCQCAHIIYPKILWNVSFHVEKELSRYQCSIGEEYS